MIEDEKQMFSTFKLQIVVDFNKRKLSRLKGSIKFKVKYLDEAFQVKGLHKAFIKVYHY